MQLYQVVMTTFCSIIYLWPPLFLESKMMQHHHVGTYLLDFTASTAAGQGWFEVSDTLRGVGRSFATLQVQTRRDSSLRRAILFTLLNPQPDGACFASMRKSVTWNLSAVTTLVLTLRAQGECSRYSLVLKDATRVDGGTSFHAFFNVRKTIGDSDDEGFEVAEVSLADFKPYIHGKELEDPTPLDLSQIREFGIQAAGGVYDTPPEERQKGVSSLEITNVFAI
ncbi:CIA30 domain-containing protein [Balamuthia mandrillaris]